MSLVVVLHENEQWVVPLKAAFERQGVPHEFWHLASGSFDLSAPPPEGVFYNRMSASSHTRDHRFAPEYTATLLEWLENHDRVVVNGSRAIDLEISKARQYAALSKAGVRVPRTIVVHGTNVIEAGETIGYPLIVKPNRGGKGLGVVRVDSEESLRQLVDSGELDCGPDGILLVQQYVAPAEPFIIRNEFVNGRHLYSVRVDTSSGFELCPADQCDVDRARSASEGSFCPATSTDGEMFSILEGFRPVDVDAYETVLKDNDIKIAGIECIVDRDGVYWTYDLNTNTNYNPDAEAAAGLTHTTGAGMEAIAASLGALRTARYGRVDERKVA